MTSVLIGSTGFVGGEILASRPFDVAVHRPDLERLRGTTADLVVCAGLPAAKWIANAEPLDDFLNMAGLAAVLDTMDVRRFVLVSTIDVYPNCNGVTESVPAALDHPQAYGRNRAWFERFVQQRFTDHLVLRLPGLYGPTLRKNLVFDLLEDRPDQYSKVHRDSTFQFFDATRTWDVVERASAAGVTMLNVATEPVSAGQVAALFDVHLAEVGAQVDYDMHTEHAMAITGTGGPYLWTAADALGGIAALRDRWSALA